MDIKPFPRKKQIIFNVSDEERMYINALADELRTDRSQFIREAVAAYVEQKFNIEKPQVQRIVALLNMESMSGRSKTLFRTLDEIDG